PQSAYHRLATVTDDSDNSKTEPENEDDGNHDSDVEDKEAVVNDAATHDEAGDDASEGRESDTDSIATSEGTVSAKRGKYKEKLPDVTTIVIQTNSKNPPAALTCSWTDPAEKDLRREKAVYNHMGGRNIISCRPDSFTKLKRAPRRSLAKRRFDNVNANLAFSRDLGRQLFDTAEQMADYVAIFFKKHPNSAQFLAIIGSGPFWRYAIVSPADCPWSEPGQRLPKSERLRKVREFLTFFGPEYFEIGTKRLDDEWHKVRQIYFMKEAD
ncbi:hypothetical protein F5050DRAFT_1876811, partial [Lentinula boryana]